MCAPGLFSMLNLLLRYVKSVKPNLLQQNQLLKHPLCCLAFSWLCSVVVSQLCYLSFAWRQLFFIPYSWIKPWSVWSNFPYLYSFVLQPAEVISSVPLLYGLEGISMKASSNSWEGCFMGPVWLLRDGSKDTRKITSPNCKYIKPNIFTEVIFSRTFSFDLRTSDAKIKLCACTHCLFIAHSFCTVWCLQMIQRWPIHLT